MKFIALVFSIIGFQALAGDVPLFVSDAPPSQEEIQAFIASELNASSVKVTDFKNTSTDPKDVLYKMKYRSLNFTVFKDGNKIDFQCQVDHNFEAKTFSFKKCISPSGTTYQSLTATELFSFAS